MSTINVQCTDQVLAITNSPVIASGGINENDIQFSFCSKWDGYAKICVFYRQTGNYYYSLIDSNDKCSIPAECCTSAGKIYFGVVGTKDNVTRTSEVLAYQIVEGAVTTIDDPTPDIYQQILNELAEIRKALEIGQMDINGLTAETALADDDCFPFYDASESANRKTLWSNIVDKIRAAAAKHTHDAANITSGTLDAERIPAIDGSKITDSTVTRAKLADDARGHVFIDWGVGYDPFTLDHNGETVTVWMSDESASVSREFTSSVANSLPNGYCVTLKKVDAQIDKTYTVTYPNVQIMNFIDRTWTTGGSVTLKNMGDYVTFIKNDSGNWTIDGNLRSPHITSGTADPSGGNDGDIYLQYSE